MTGSSRTPSHIDANPVLGEHSSPRRAGRPHAAGLAVLALAFGAPLALAVPTISIDTPPAGKLTQLRPTITVSYWSALRALDLATLRIELNGVDWTSLFMVGPSSATFVVDADRELIAGPLTIQAQIADTRGALATATRSYTVLPAFDAISPAAGREGEVLTISAGGLDPDPSNGRLVFTSGFGPTIEAPLLSVDRAQNQATVAVPPGARTGPVLLEVNGQNSPQSYPVTVLGRYLDCGSPFSVIGMADGSLLATYTGLSFGPRCPPVVPPVVSAEFPVLARLAPDDTYLNILRRSSATEKVWEGLPDKTGTEYAVVTRSNSTGVYSVEYNGHLTTFVSPTFIFQGGGQLDFDAAGNLLILTGSPYEGNPGQPAELYRISAARLADGGPAQLELVTGNIQLATTPGCAQPSLAVSCDGHAYVALTNVYSVGTCSNAPRPLTEIHKVDLETGAIVADIPSSGERFGLAVSCRSGELFGLERVLQSPVIIWRSVDDGAPQALSPAPTGYLYSNRVAMDPSGRLIVDEQWYGQSYGPSPVVTPYQVAPCTDCCPPGSPTPSPQPFCYSPLQVVRAETTRWKPQRDPTTNIAITFTGPADIQAATVTITGPPGSPASYTQTPIEVVSQNKFRITWTGPWVDAQGLPLWPAGNYDVVIRATRTGGVIETSNPYRTSLVEVVQTQFQQTPTGPDLAPNPMPGGGKAAFVDAELAGGGFRGYVTIALQTQPPLGADANSVLVYLKAIDVDDPSAGGPPIDDETQAADNRGVPPPPMVFPAAGPDGSALAILVAPTKQGDNYRIAASTWQPWLNDVSAAPGPNQTGAVQHVLGDPLIQGRQVSELLTVWRTLHVEEDYLDNTLMTQVDFDFTASVAALTPTNLTSSRKFDPDHLTDDSWLGAQLEPGLQTSPGVLVPVAGNNASIRLTVPNGYNLLNLTTVQEGFRVFDDEWVNLSIGLPLQLSRDLLEQAYIAVESVAGNQTAPHLFKRNIFGEELPQIPRDVLSSEPYWSVHLLAAFDAAPLSDNDPVSESGGLGNATGYQSVSNLLQPICAVYKESIRDSAEEKQWTSDVLSRVTAHELLCHAMYWGHEGASVCDNPLNDGDLGDEISVDFVAFLREVPQPKVEPE